VDEEEDVVPLPTAVVREARKGKQPAVLERDKPKNWI
jgi:hypothetical protein